MARAKTKIGTGGAYVPEEGQEHDEVELGRASPYAMVGHWVLVAPITPQAKTLYSLLAAHVRRGAPQRGAWPSRAVLAELMGFSKTASVDRYVTELVELGAIEVRRRRRRDGGYAGNLYLVHETPPARYEGHHSLADFHAERAPAPAPAEVPLVRCRGLGGPSPRTGPVRSREQGSSPGADGNKKKNQTNNNGAACERHPGAGLRRTGGQTECAGCWSDRNAADPTPEGSGTRPERVPQE